jgi:DNA primase
LTTSPDPPNPAPTTDYPRLLNAALHTSRHFLHSSDGGEHAHKYLLSRGFTRHTITEWNFGFWPVEAPSVLTGLGFSADDINHLGLGHRLVNRLTFPLADPAGRPLGLVGRESHTRMTIRYLYPPASSVYDPPSHLFGLHQALHLDHRTKLLVVEGPFDAIACHQQGYRAVSPLRASFTVEQALLIRAVSPHLAVFVPDPDETGRRNFKKSVDKHIASLPDALEWAELPLGRDPASLLRDLPSAFELAVQTARRIR